MFIQIKSVLFISGDCFVSDFVELLLLPVACSLCLKLTLSISVLMMTR